ncbi:hypothetical protein [Paraburkholderia dipogonis]|uniref:hypothetical protein n=1 Tax=Paraburkholderia dipogonis TaxID=1211383 RepID=UPI0038B966DE
MNLNMRRGVFDMSFHEALRYEPFRHGALIRENNAPAGTYLRYLGWDPDSDQIAVLVVSETGEVPGSRLPELRDRKRLFEHRDCWQVVDECVCPKWMRDWDEDSSTKKKQRQMSERDARWEKIGALLTIGGKRVLFDARFRNELIKQAAKESAVSEQRIRHLLTVYYWFGATRDAMLSLRPNQGGPGQRRIYINRRKPGPELSTLKENPKSRLRGARMTPRLFELWRTFLLKRAQEIHDLKGKVGLAGQFRLSTLWIEFRDEILVKTKVVDGVTTSTPIPLERLPRRRRFLELGRDIFRDNILKRYFDSEYDWDAAKARVGHSSDHTRGRIDIYEFDGLLFNAQLLWGKHTLNRVGKACVIIGACVETSAIVGVHITIQNESSNAYRNCLFNAFVPKEELLQTFGLEALSDGFVHGCCDEARFDRGPGIAQGLRGPLADEMRIGIRITRSRKGRDKGLVESFNRAIQEALSKLPGFFKRTKASHDKDGRSKAERWAKVQFNEFVKLVLTYIYDWNTQRNIFDRLPEELAKVLPIHTPKAYFEALRLQRQADAAIEWTPRETYSRLLSSQTLRVASGGNVKLNGAKYTSTVLKRMWEMSVSTPSGNGTKMSIVVKPHPDTNRFLIWVADDGSQRLLNMMPKYRRHYGTNIWLVHNRNGLRGRASAYETEIQARQAQLPGRIRKVMADAHGLKPTKLSNGAKGAKVANRRAKAEAEKRDAETAAHVMFGAGPDHTAVGAAGEHRYGVYNPDNDERFAGDI